MSDDFEARRALDRILSECAAIEELYDRVCAQMREAQVTDKEHFEDVTDSTKDIRKEVEKLRRLLQGEP